MKTQKYFNLINNFSKTRVLILGDIMLDRYIWGNVDRISPEAPVPIVRVDRESVNLGGAANVAAGVASLGAFAYLVGVVGKDSLAKSLVGILKESNLPSDGLVVDSSRPSTIKTRLVAHSQQIARIDRETSAEISDAIVDKILGKVKKAIPKIDGIIISDYGKGVITYNLLTALIETANKAGKFIAVDPKEVHFMNYRNVSVITPNHHEAGFISGKKIINESTLIDVGSNLMDLLNLESLLITRGEKGMTLFEKDRNITHIPAVAKTVYDVTGAGDTVIATLTVAKSAGASIKDAAVIANIAAGLAVAQFGTARITAAELKEAVTRYFK